MKIDLQIHSTYSDGIDTVQELVSMAEENQVGLLSLTDHDNIRGVAEFVRLCEEKGIKAISGVEITAFFRDSTVHLLGYNIDINNQALNEYLNGILNRRKEAILSGIPAMNMELAAKSKENNTEAKLINAADAAATIGDYWGKPVFAKYLFEKGIVAEREEAFKLVDKNSRIGDRSVVIDKAIKCIHEAGGKAVISHPFGPIISLYKLSRDPDEIEKMLYELKEMGLDGLEAFQSSYLAEDQDFALRMAKKLDLGITAGSDWHGSKKVIGDKGLSGKSANYVDRIGELPVPEEYISKIQKFLGVS